MNVYELTFGNIRHFVAAKDEQDAYEQGTDPKKYPDLHFRPFDIRLVEVEGFTIDVTPNEPETANRSSEDAPKRGRRKAAS